MQACNQNNYTLALLAQSWHSWRAYSAASACAMPGSRWLPYQGCAYRNHSAVHARRERRDGRRGRRDSL